MPRALRLAGTSVKPEDSSGISGLRGLVGSKNPTKVGAAVTVMRPLGVLSVMGVSVPSGVREQPIGVEETLAGARHRARAVRAGSSECYGMGLEGGVDLLADGTGWLTGIAVIITPDNRELVGYGPRLLLPPGRRGKSPCGRGTGAGD